MARAATGQRSFIEQARRGQIVAAAIDELYESGFAATSLGVAEARAYMVPRIEVAGSYREALRTYVTSNLEYIGANRRKIIAFIEILNGMPPTGTEAAPFDEGRQVAVDELRDLLAAGQAAGEFGEFSAPVAAVSMRASIDVLSVLLRADPELDTTAYGAQLLALYERAVRA
jgi:hypothetical protein